MAYKKRITEKHVFDMLVKHYNDSRMCLTPQRLVILFEQVGVEVSRVTVWRRLKALQAAGRVHMESKNVGWFPLHETDVRRS